MFATLWDDTITNINMRQREIGTTTNDGTKHDDNNDGGEKNWTKGENREKKTQKSHKSKYHETGLTEISLFLFGFNFFFFLHFALLTITSCEHTHTHTIGFFTEREKKLFSFVHNLQITQHNVAMLTATKTEKGKNASKQTHTTEKSAEGESLGSRTGGQNTQKKKQQHKRKLNENIKWI